MFRSLNKYDMALLLLMEVYILVYWLIIKLTRLKKISTTKRDFYVVCICNLQSQRLPEGHPYKSIWHAEEVVIFYFYILL